MLTYVYFCLFFALMSSDNKNYLFIFMNMTTRVTKLEKGLGKLNFKENDKHQFLICIKKCAWYVEIRNQKLKYQTKKFQITDFWLFFQ